MKKRSSTTSDRGLATVLLLPAAIVVFGLVTWPILRTVWLSFHQMLSPMPGTATPFVGFKNFHNALTDSSLLDSFRRTVYFTVLSTALEMSLGLILGLLMSQKIRGRWLLRAAVLLPWALPTVVNATMWRYIFNADYGPLNALLTQLGVIESYKPWLGTPNVALHMVIFADVWKNSSIIAFFVMAGLTTIPGDVLEAAKVDGANALRTFFSIMLPLLKPVLIVAMVLRTIEAFKVFDIVYIMTRGGPAGGTTSLALYSYQMAFSNQNFGYGSSLALLIVVVTFSLALFYMRLVNVGFDKGGK
ncbi:MAG TPA: sugar ABC transporter permease [Candidatus Paceibacterota bacterium]|nr:sugar ABC transporter permease [Candidatus Paceibacterota bacterium]